MKTAAVGWSALLLALAGTFLAITVATPPPAGTPTELPELPGAICNPPPESWPPYPAEIEAVCGTCERHPRNRVVGYCPDHPGELLCPIGKAGTPPYLWWCPDDGNLWRGNPLTGLEDHVDESELDPDDPDWHLFARPCGEGCP